MTTPAQSWVDDLALRHQLYEKWRAIARKLPVGPERLQLAADIKKNFEPEKMADAVAKFWIAMEDKDKRRYGMEDITNLLLKHKPQAGIGVFPVIAVAIIVVAGMVFAYTGGIPAIIYAFRAPADADSDLAKRYGHLLRGGGFEIPWWVWGAGGGFAAWKLNLLGGKKK